MEALEETRLMLEEGRLVAHNQHCWKFGSWESDGNQNRAYNTHEKRRRKALAMLRGKAETLLSKEKQKLDGEDQAALEGG
ncbi:hypothetical protein TSUD_211910 [Trifolium subterraneum]|uniref:Uncharacterized protein n=1 Tax=Trifolium subterraneum TaxID=3900 RepID=A0A2Z6MCD1_TRISU|nr:hypothetical protein TSUD_211910 [Trifolium subterraneum]